MAGYQITIFTDGSAQGNPGKGGYGVVLIAGQHRKEISEGYRMTTNNRMELVAVIVALESLKKTNSQVKVYSDSKYVVDSIVKGWVFNWKKTGFKKKKNKDLWERFLQIYPKHRVEFKWLKGHAGIKENERCDELAVEAGSGSNLLVDEGYELSIE